MHVDQLPAHQQSCSKAGVAETPAVAWPFTISQQTLKHVSAFDWLVDMVHALLGCEVQIICQSCGRAFPDDAALQLHLASCGLEKPVESAPLKIPFHMVCHLCGGSFGSKSFDRPSAWLAGCQLRA